MQAKTHKATLRFVDFSNIFDSLQRRKKEQILLECALHKETVTFMIILYKNAITMFRLSDEDTVFFWNWLWNSAKRSISTIFIICVNYIYRSSKGEHFRLKKGKKQTIFSRNYDSRKTTQMILRFSLLYKPKQNPYSIAWSKRQKALPIHVDVIKTEYVSFKQKGAIFTLCYNPLKLVGQFSYLDSNISSTESDINVWSYINSIYDCLVVWVLMAYQTLSVI